MQHFKEFLIKLQTIDIKISERKKVINGELGKIKFYDISHQNPSLNNAFKSELKEGTCHHRSTKPPKRASLFPA